MKVPIVADKLNYLELFKQVELSLDKKRNEPPKRLEKDQKFHQEMLE